MSDPKTRRIMLKIAAEYERIAERAEQRLRKTGKAATPLEGDDRSNT
jgi:hypothetical protein